ncbi:hypothetical protein FVEG_04009 [Fusarium verticillioides 7600]|uniref:Uncharacterized protein n=1 Tax=Gibberella moniliformis (strain M3125 / FGSC 7600) TaxID=334819 RepID=W7M3B5_GIBM7|nr:hypothetical protein FVEG_04009 [Fusarium verticillioides 7600]EWG42065.1 hypothetical protein FVEG_04009 [Fusarium verticillioides 7600]
MVSAYCTVLYCTCGMGCLCLCLCLCHCRRCHGLPRKITSGRGVAVSCSLYLSLCL